MARLSGGGKNDGQGVAGTTQATATPAVAEHVQIRTASANQGVILQSGNDMDMRTVANASAASIRVYPPVGASFNGLAANTHVTLAANTAGMFFFVTSTKINAVT
jgi:hypothetical protein